jgi:acetylornithine deacetylase/succinyl-diaminopimelate desuccinylase-like protein
MYALLAAKNRGLRCEALAFAQQLVRTPSPSSQEADVAELVQRRMDRLGYEQVFVDDFGNVVGLLSGRQPAPTVLLCSHMDTAEEGDASQWDDAPLSGEMRDGVLYGLGASDCKAGLTAQIYAGALLRRSLLPLRGNVIVAATVSEEQGGSPGLRHLIEQTLPSLDLRPDYAILGEPTELGLFYGQRCHASRVRAIARPVSAQPAVGVSKPEVAAIPAGVLLGIGRDRCLPAVAGHRDVVGSDAADPA